MRGRLRAGGASVSFFAFQDIITSVIGIILFVALFLSLFIGMEGGVSTEADVRQAASQEEVAELDSLLADIVTMKARLVDSLSRRDQSTTQADSESLSQELAVLKGQIARMEREAFVPNDEKTERIKTETAQIVSATKEDNAKVEELKKTAVARAVEAAALTRKFEELEVARLKEERNKNDIWLIPDQKDTTKKPLIVIANRDDFVVRTLDDNWRQADERRGRDLEVLLKGFSKVDYYVVMYCRPSTFHILEESLDAIRRLGFDVGYDPIEEGQDINFRPPSP